MGCALENLMLAAPANGYAATAALLFETSAGRPRPEAIPLNIYSTVWCYMLIAGIWYGRYLACLAPDSLTATLSRRIEDPTGTSIGTWRRYSAYSG